MAPAGAHEGRNMACPVGVCALMCAVIAQVPAFAAAPSESLPAIMVLNIKHEEEAGPGVANILTELVLQDLHDMKRFRVIGQKDIDQMLNTEQRKQLTGCSDTSCLVEIAGAMGTRYTVDGTIGALGDTNILSLSLIDTSRAAVVSRKTSIVKGVKAQLIETVHRQVGSLMEAVLTPAPVRRSAPIANSPTAAVATARTETKSPDVPKPSLPASYGSGVGILYVEGRPKGASLTIEGPPAFGRNGQTLAKVPYGPIDTYAGEYRVKATHPGHEPFQTRVTVGPDQVITVKVSLVPSDLQKSPAVPAPTQIAPKSAPPMQMETAAEAGERLPTNPYKVWGHAAFWMGLASVGIGGAFSGMAVSASSDYRAGVEPLQREADITNYNRGAVTCYVLGGALVTTAVVLWLLSPGDEEWARTHAISVVPTLNRQESWLAISGRW